MSKKRSSTTSAAPQRKKNRKAVEPLDAAVENAILQRLQTRLEQLHADYDESLFVLDATDQTLDASAMERFRGRIRLHGFVFVLNYADAESMQQARLNIGRTMVDQYARCRLENPRSETGYSEAVMPPHVRERLLCGDLAAANEVRNSKLGFGNVGFGYLYLQRNSSDSDQSVEFCDGERVVMTKHLPHSRVIMPFVYDNERRAALLWALSHDAKDVMTGFSSCKTVGGAKHPKMTEQKPTPLHIDEYGEAYIADESQRTYRLQAICNEDTGARKLFYFLYSMDATVRELICELIQNPGFFTTHGYRTLPEHERLFDLIRQYSVAPPPLALAAWRNGPVHFTGLGTPLGGDSTLYRCTEIGFSGKRTDTVLRLTVGTHRPVNLNDNDRKRLGVMLHRGVVPGYNAAINRHCKRFFPNIHNSKTSQFLTNRIKLREEIEFVEHAMRAEGIDEEWQALSPIYRKGYGERGDPKQLLTQQTNKNLF